MNLHELMEKSKKEIAGVSTENVVIGEGKVVEEVEVITKPENDTLSKDVKTPEELIPGSGIPKIESAPGLEHLSERLNQYVVDTAKEYDDNLSTGKISINEIEDKRVLDTDTKEQLREEIIKSGEHLKVTPDKPKNEVVERIETKKKVEDIKTFETKEKIKVSSRVAETEEVKPGLVIKTEVHKSIEKTIEVTEDNKKAWTNILNKRRKAIKTALVPAVISNAILKGYPLTSNAIIESLQPRSDRSVYQNLTNTLSIISNFIEVQGLPELTGYQLSRIISYLDLELLYYAVFKASNDDRYKLTVPCSNPDCSKYNQEVVPLDIAVDDIAHPVDLEKYMVHISNIKEYKDEADIIKHSPTNIVTTIDDVDNDREFKIKIPSMFDYIKNVAVNLDESHQPYEQIINIIPFVHEIVVKDYESGTEYVLKEFEDILEVLIKYTSDEIIDKMTEIVDGLVDGRLVEFYLPKESMVCPFCGKTHPENIPVVPSRMLFLMPEMKKNVVR